MSNWQWFITALCSLTVGLALGIVAIAGYYSSKKSNIDKES